MLMPLLGKSAIVTGGGRGIGAAIARALAADGADVAVTYATRPDSAEAVAADIRAAGRRALALRADGADAAALGGAVDEAAASFGRLDILVNNAGMFPVATIEDATLDAFDRTIAVNLRAAFVATRAALRHMGEGGRIIAIGSSLVERVGRPGLGLYAMSKAGLSGLTKALARDLGPRGITANIVHPGPTDTEMNPAAGARADQARAAMAVPRYSMPSEVAALVAWLASPAAQTVTGAAFTIDSGTNA
ncbi:SDR family oxidoreductase [Labrys wisconsinensis]|uniref:NAD(P)-dependent dehydrogenase (Short-subunit alcohol dehydrogenase family) n=1 Tax=Labrys wisconsinensis TaxID=425677 RepID=A0ABU0J3E8_9HYPH|nr:SDR family oxidoreductase [Labrys wisconsinensis]MDQ0468790.1 NAD(P)-dependent dehydrogenase (short-subunit alcohol dehydrogenase family) [Labrys wisconsinensis]